MSTSRRTRAAVGLLISAAAGAVWVATVLLLSERGVALYGPGLGVPLVPFLIFAVELASGRSFAELASRWDQLAGWQRFVLGLLIVAMAVAVIAGGVGVVLALVID